MAIDETIQINISTKTHRNLRHHEETNETDGLKKKNNGHGYKKKLNDKGPSDVNNRHDKRIAPRIRRKNDSPFDWKQPLPGLYLGVILDTATDLEKKRNIGDSRTIFAKEQCLFSSLGLSERITTQLESKLGFTKATLVQSLTIPEMISGGDVLSQSQTGSG